MEVKDWFSKHWRQILAVVGLLLILVGLSFVIDNTPFPGNPTATQEPEDAADPTATEMAESGEGCTEDGGSRRPPGFWWYWGGWGGIVLGLVLLLVARQTAWPELIAVLIAVLIGLAALGRIPSLQAPGIGALIPVPGGRFEGGIEFLSPGQVVGLKAVVPNASKTPQAVVSTYGEVVEIRGKEEPAVMIDVATASADDLQKALLTEGAKITYRLLKGTPTATPTPATETSAAATPVPGPSDRPDASRGYIEIKKDDIESRVSTLERSTSDNARLVIVEKSEEAPAGKPEAVTTTYTQTHFCVAVEDFLDASGIKQEGLYDENTTYVLISFKIEELDKIVISLAAAESIWLENQSNCQ
jgi:hypothetical protein